MWWNVELSTELNCFAKWSRRFTRQLCDHKSFYQPITATDQSTTGSCNMHDWVLLPQNCKQLLPQSCSNCLVLLGVSQNWHLLFDILRIPQFPSSKQLPQKCNLTCYHRVVATVQCCLKFHTKDISCLKDNVRVPLPSSKHNLSRSNIHQVVGRMKGSNANCCEGAPPCNLRLPSDSVCCFCSRRLASA